MTRTIILHTCSLLLLALWLYAGYNKLGDIENSIIQLGKSPLLYGYQQVLAWTIPAGELLLALLLITGIFIHRPLLPCGLYASFALLSLFSFYIIAILQFSYYIPCSCGGIFEQLSWQQHLAFNAFAMLLAAVALLVQTKENRKITRQKYKGGINKSIRELLQGKRLFRLCNIIAARLP